MSADYSGDNGSGLTASILGAVSQLGSAEILSHRDTNLSTPVYSRPQTASYLPAMGAPGGMSKFLLIGALVVGAIFAVKSLR